MNLTFTTVGEITCIFNNGKLVLVAYQTRKRNKYALYQPITWGLQWQASAVVTSTLEEFVTNLLRNADL